MKSDKPSAFYRAKWSRFNLRQIKTSFIIKPNKLPLNVYYDVWIDLLFIVIWTGPRTVSAFCENLFIKRVSNKPKPSSDLQIKQKYNICQAEKLELSCRVQKI